ncbi:hypothetical protein KKH39_03195 [Patescibacteria group bacterium]|nr:hypothetical protein [Patescibacteria group bacterium]
MAQDKRINAHLSKLSLDEQEACSLVGGYGSRHLSPTFVYDFRLLPEVVIYSGPSRCCLRRMIRQAEKTGSRKALIMDLADRTRVSKRSVRRWFSLKAEPGLFHWLALQYFMYFKGYVSHEISMLPDYARSLIESVIQDKISLGQVAQRMGCNLNDLGELFRGERRLTSKDRLKMLMLVRYLSDQQHNEAVLAVAELDLNEEGDTQLTDEGISQVARYLPTFGQNHRQILAGDKASDSTKTDGESAVKRKKNTKRKIRRNRAAKRKEKENDKDS